MYRVFLSLGLWCVLTGCVGIPTLAVPGPVAVSRIVDEVQCEVQAAAEKYPRLRTERWAAAVSLTLQVDDNVGLTPTLSFIDPSTSFTFGASAALKGARQRIYTESLDLDVRSLKRRNCVPLPDAFDLSGTLGIVEAVDLGLGSLEGGEDQAKFDKDKAFGQTIQFVVTKNVSAVGPAWTLTRFTGPGGLFGAERVDTNQLVISFAPGVTVVKKVVDGARSRESSVVMVPGGGAARARDLNYQLLLRSLPAFRLTR
jgi:hypothetical protein